MIDKWWRVDRRPNRARAREIKKMILFHRRFKRRALFDKVRNEFSESFWIHDRPGKNMRANRRTFLNDGNLNFTERLSFSLSFCDGVVILLNHSRQMKRTA